MNPTPTYCTSSFSWHHNKSIDTVVKYIFNATDTYDKFNEEFSNEFSSDCCIGLTLDAPGDEISSENCILKLLSKPGLAKINGLCLVSESRTLEISNNTEGYLCTVRGKEFDRDADTSESEKPKLYICRCSFEDNYSDLSIKFLSLGGKSSFFLNSLIVYLSKVNEDNSAYNGGTIDIHKLQKEIKLMGDTLSDKARDFLKTMEQFEKNKLKTFGDLEKVQPWSMSFPGHQLFSKADSFVGFDTALSALQEPPGNSLTPGSSGFDLYALLQGVCGSVSKKRQENTESKVSPQTPDSGIESVNESCSNEASEELSLLITKEQLQLLNIVDGKIHAVKDEFQEALTKTKDEMNEKLEVVKNELNEKLDLILKLLNSHSLNGVKN